TNPYPDPVAPGPPPRPGPAPAGGGSADPPGRRPVGVPNPWGRQRRDSGWDPRALGLPSGHQPGLVVADDLSRWSDPKAAVDGVFAGVGADGDVTAKVKALAHSDCRYTGTRTFADARWRGLVRSWTGCPDGGSVTESALVPVGGGARSQVYVQVRQHGGGDATDGVLRSLRVA
ncbi:serine/threonine protein kinase, partial [Streptomyces tricolor]